SLQTDRVVLVHGPFEEIETVRWMYRSFVEEGRSERDIAASLNAKAVSTDLGRPWTRGTVHQVLINEKYVGNNVWNRSSFKLKKKHVRNSADMWIRADGAFEPVVDHQLFDAAQSIILARSFRMSDDEMLRSLSDLLASHGYLSGMIIDESEHAPSSSCYQSRFGSLLRAYQLVGFTPDRDLRYIEINRALRRMHPGIVAKTISGIESAGGQVDQNPSTDLLTINDEFSASIVIVRCRETNAGSLRWQVRLDTSLSPDISVVVRMDRPNREPLDYYLLPRLDMTVPQLRLAEHNGVSLDSYRFETLEPLFSLASRTKLMEVA
ncbi:MAG: recombinase family protein, partial [Alphaproteobacteria bacterium]